MKYLISLFIIVLLSGCGLSYESHSRTEAKIYNPFYRDGGNSQGHIVGKKISSQTPQNMGDFR